MRLSARRARRRRAGVGLRRRRGSSLALGAARLRPGGAHPPARHRAVHEGPRGEPDARRRPTRCASTPPTSRWCAGSSRLRRRPSRRVSRASSGSSRGFRSTRPTGIAIVERAARAIEQALNALPCREDQGASARLRLLRAVSALASAREPLAILELLARSVGTPPCPRPRSGAGRPRPRRVRAGDRLEPQPGPVETARRGELPRAGGAVLVRARARVGRRGGNARRPAAAGRRRARRLPDRRLRRQLGGRLRPHRRGARGRDHRRAVARRTERRA